MLWRWYLIFVVVGDGVGGVDVEVVNSLDLLKVCNESTLQK